MNMDFNGINRQKLMNALMGSMAKNGMNSGNIHEALNSGNLDKVLENLNPQDAQKVKSVLNDPAALNKILSSPEAAALLKKLM